MRIVVDEKIPYLCEALEQMGHTVEALPGCAISNSDLLTADALFVRTRTLCNAALLDNTAVRFIGTATIGHDHIDKEYCRQKGIVWTNAPGCNADAVAESAVMLMLMVTRYAVPGYRAVIEGRQMAYKEHIMSSAVPEFADHAIGLVGLGDIATATAKRLAPFGNKLYYYAPHRRSPQVEAALNVTYLPLEEMAAACDILSLHCAVTAYHTLKIGLRIGTLGIGSDLYKGSGIKNGFQTRLGKTDHLFVILYHNFASVLCI